MPYPPSHLARALLAFLIACWAGAGAWAQPADWPSRPIRLVVPYPPGTGPDIMARLVTEKLAKELPASFVVENKPGVNGSLGTEAVVRAPADGHTLLLADRLTVSVNPLLYKLAYDPRKDLVPVSNIADVSPYLVVSSAPPVNHSASFVRHLKARPGEVAFGSGGVGSIMHLNMVLLQDGTGTSMLHVPYKAFAEVIPALLAGDVAVSSEGVNEPSAPALGRGTQEPWAALRRLPRSPDMGGAPRLAPRLLATPARARWVRSHLLGGVEALQQHVAAGKLKLLAVGAPARTEAAPGVPTIQEAAGEDLLISTSYALLARMIAADGARVGKLISDHRISVP